MRNLDTNKLLALCVLAVAALSPPVAAVAQDGGKYGFVNITRVISETDEGRAQAQALEDLGAEKESELNARREELQELARQYQESVSSGEPDTELRDRIERMQRELERDVRQAQSDIDTSRQDRVQALGKKVVQVVREFGRDNGYTAIFRTDSGGVVYVDEAADVTDRVIQAYNEAHPAR